MIFHRNVGTNPHSWDYFGEVVDTDEDEQAVSSRGWKTRCTTFWFSLVCPD